MFVVSKRSLRKRFFLYVYINKLRIYVCLVRRTSSSSVRLYSGMSLLFSVWRLVTRNPNLKQKTNLFFDTNATSRSKINKTSSMCVETQCEYVQDCHSVR